MADELQTKESTELDWLKEDEIKLVKSQFFPPTATVQEIEYCMGVAKSFNLNPILKQIFFVPRKSKVGNQWIEKVEPLAGRDSFITLAHRSGVFESIESYTEIRKVPILQQGQWVETDELVGIAKVYKTNREKPFIVEVNYSEYVQTKQSGEVTKFWKEKPHTMIKKVAESQCLRKAFDITGLYDETEVESGNIIEAEIQPQASHQPTIEPPKKALNMTNVGEQIETEVMPKSATEEDIQNFYKNTKDKNKAMSILNNHKEWRTYSSEKMGELLDELGGLR